ARQRLFATPPGRLRSCLQSPTPLALSISRRARPLRRFGAGKGRGSRPTHVLPGRKFRRQAAPRPWRPTLPAHRGGSEAVIGAARVASDSPHTLNSRLGFEFRRVSDIRLLFDAKADGEAAPSMRAGTRQPWSRQPMRRALRAAAELASVGLTRAAQRA